jgi:type II secretory pathway pseudopilin PulG
MRLNRGDTIIEVMISTAVAALIIVMAITVMNRNLATVQMATEITFARQAIDGQAEALRYLRDEYNNGNPTAGAEWDEIIKRATTTAGSGNISEFGTCVNQDGSLPLDRSFFIDGIAKNDQTTSTIEPIYSQTSSGYPESFPKPGSGVWVEVERGGGPVPNPYESYYLDLHIRACWDPPYESNGVKATIGTIVRLYYE